MKTKNMLRKYFLEKWWIPTLLYMGVYVLVIDLYAWTTSSKDQFLYYALWLAVSSMFVAIVWQLIKGKWYWGLIQLTIWFCSLLGLYVGVLITANFGPSQDTFADNLKLPKGIPLENPMDLPLGEDGFSRSPASLPTVDSTHLSFQLYNSFQSGLYHYDVWLSSPQSGDLYLRVFEITQEVELSAPRLQKSSRLSISDTGESIKRYSSQKHFTIYEGDWGQPYGARFEVWFDPKGSQPERKLLERNYIIEGWMR